MRKRYFDSLWRSLAYTAIVVFVFGFLFPKTFTIRMAQLTIGGAALVNTFAFFVFEWRLFSRNLWVRRAIVYVISASFCWSLFRIFYGFLHSWQYYLLTDGIAFVIGGVICALVCYIQDKIYQKSIKKINLALQKNEERDEE